MKNIHIKYKITWLMACLLMIAATGYAQEPEPDYSNLDTLGFDARKFLGQKRYIPENKSFIKKKKWNDHLFVDIAGGGLWFDNTAGSRRLKNGFLGNLYIGKDFTSVHSARVGAGFSRFTDGTSKKDFKNFELRGDYLCNFSSMLNGYQEKRWLDVSAIAGLSYYRCTLHEDAANAFGANFGLQFLFKAGSNTGVTIEPTLSVVSDKFDLKERNNRHATNLMYGVKVGLKYIFTDENHSWPHDTDEYWMKNTFFEISTGANSSLDTELSLARAVGYKYTASVGKWLTPAIGLRAGLTAAQNRWKNSHTLLEKEGGNTRKYLREETQVHGGMRIEALLNPLEFREPEKYRRNRPFQFNISFGGEFGWMAKADRNEEDQKQHLKCNYVGLTAAMQLLYHIENDMALFLEPRYTLLNYDIPYTNRPDLSEEYNDNLLSLNIGVRVCAPTLKEMNENKKFNALFKPGFFVSAEGGIANALHMRRFADAPIRVGLAGGLAGGYRFDPIFSAKLGVSYAGLEINGFYDYDMQITLDNGEQFNSRYTGLWNRKLSAINATASAEVNLTNLYMGWNPARQFGLSFLIGPSLMAVVDSADEIYECERTSGKVNISEGPANDVVFGVETGFSVSYVLTEKINLYMLPKVYLHKGKFTEGSKEGATMAFSTLLGVSYQF